MVYCSIAITKVTTVLNAKNDNKFSTSSLEHICGITGMFFYGNNITLYIIKKQKNCKLFKNKYKQIKNINFETFLYNFAQF